VRHVPGRRQLAPAHETRCVADVAVDDAAIAADAVGNDDGLNYGGPTARSGTIMELLKTLGLFVATALAEIVGCYLPYVWLKQDRSAWLLVPASVSLAVFVWLLTLHPHASGRVYAAYGGVYIGIALCWLWVVDSVRPTWTDWLGVSVCLHGAGIIIAGSRSTG
jgi:small multidrug resistance family-3 protein